MKNLLIGAASGNYKSNDLKNWVESSNWVDCERILFLYNPSDDELINYLLNNNIKVFKPDFNFNGSNVENFECNTARCNIESSYGLIHNIRFFHIWCYLNEGPIYDKVLITDVKDVYFNSNPFDFLSNEFITATSEVVKYKDESWNRSHVDTNLGLIGLNTLLDKPVYNVGVFGGPHNLMKDMCSDIYLMSVGKPKVADQTSFNYLIQTRYLDKTKFTDLSDNFAVHLHVINAGLVKFDLKDINKYSIIHQYDRIKDFKR